MKIKRLTLRMPSDHPAAKGDIMAFTRAVGEQVARSLSQRDDIQFGSQFAVRIAPSTAPLAHQAETIAKAIGAAPADISGSNRSGTNGGRRP